MSGPFTFRYSLGQARQFYGKLNSITPDTQRGMRRAWYFIGKDLVKSSKKYITEKPKSGKVYTIYKNGRRTQHQASAPGESPANLSGFLRSSLGYLVIGWKQLEFGSNAPYARYLESIGSKQFPDGPDLNRPYLKKSIIANQQNGQVHFERELRNSLGSIVS